MAGVPWIIKVGLSKITSPLANALKRRLKRMPAFTPKAVKTYDELAWPMRLNYNYNLYWYQFLSYPFVRGLKITFLGKEIKILEAQMNKSMYDALIKGHYAEKKAARVFADLKYQNEIVEAWFDMVIFVFNFVVGMAILYFSYVYYEKEEKEEKKRAEAEMVARLHQETSGIEKKIAQLTLRVSEMEQKNETTEALLHRILFLLQADPATRKLQETKTVEISTQ